MLKIKKIVGGQIIDSRGNPTCEADIILDDGTLGRGAVPSGASTGALEAIEIRDNDPNIYFGKSLMTQIDTSLSNFLTYNGDINNRISNLTDKLSDFDDAKTLLDERMGRLTDRYSLQFSSMEQSIAGLKETGNYLDQMLKQDKD